MNMLPPGDVRVQNWPMMSSPTPTVTIVSFYLLFVVWLGQKLMAKRATGFSIRPIMIVYNFSMVIISAWLWYRFCAYGWFGDNYSFRCQPVDYSHRPKAMRMAETCWYFYISKLIELFDTVCFVLRKKFNLVSFLHVFHHSMMPISWWFGVKYVAGGIGTFHAMLNSAIHFFMYIYYGLSACGPSFHRYLWWKKYMTVAQIVQFITVVFHSIYTLSLKDCNYPKLFHYWILSSAVVFLILFSNFFSKAYKRPLVDDACKTVKKID